MSQKIYQVVIYKSISDEEKLAKYAALAGPAIKGAGGKFLARGIPAVAAIIGLWQMLSNQASVWTEDFDWDNWNASPTDMMEFCTSRQYPALEIAAAWEFVLCLGIVFTVTSFLLDLQPSNDFHSEEE